eukprot:TRINITY_DN50728_c0_g1_i2.p1 TRINITY_DN50728_c0_g1~~TRINITY_DN50728_c0_g1_i2.p1  ORF type:complete len:208 (-),score=28.94 TRINITY_DN50728_c0_g1_i2:99-722(-)
MAPIYFYSGFNQPYQLVTVGHRCFKPATMGLQLAFFYAAEILGGFAAGRSLDSHPQPGASRDRAARACLALFAILMAGGYVCAFFQEQRMNIAAEGSLVATASQDVLGASAMMFLWGFSDSQIQTYAMWDISVTHPGDGDAQARAVGFYKMVQSAGWSLGFALSPVTRLNPLAQWGGTLATGSVGVVMALTQLPSKAASSGPFSKLQ